MLQIFTNEQDDRNMSGMQHGSWVHLAAPTEDEIGYVCRQHRIPVDFIRDALDKGERARFELCGELSLIIIQAPLQMTAEDRVLYRTVPIGIIRTKEAMITVCRVNHPIFAEAIENRGGSAAMYSYFGWIQAVARHYSKSVDELDWKIVAAETELRRSIHNKDVYTLLNINKSLVFFTKSLKSNQAALHKLMRAFGTEMAERDEKLMQYALIEMQQAYDTAYIHNTNLSNLMDAYAAVIENNVSNELKSLTAVAFLLTIPLVIATMYGMNIPLPYQDEGAALTVLMSGSVVLSAITAWIFHKKRLF
ncbi:magnesium transporter CorA family protein [Paenibacillus sp. GCM10027626]|uniref:magnesium transporter CorA family protein n=1 Tax=Paenibacillus sp. GCM10027626 TaxID=3273411 RepID=UPI00363161AB